MRAFPFTWQRRRSATAENPMPHARKLHGAIIAYSIEPELLSIDVLHWRNIGNFALIGFFDIRPSYTNLTCIPRYLQTKSLHVHVYANIDKHSRRASSYRRTRRPPPPEGLALRIYCLKCTEFGQLMLRRIKIVVIRCQIFRLKCTKYDAQTLLH